MSNNSLAEIINIEKKNEFEDIPSEIGDSGEIASIQYAEAHLKGYSQRIQIEKSSKTALSIEYINYIKKLEYKNFINTEDEETIFTKIKIGIQNNARGGKNYIYVIPTWQDFSGWNKWIDIIEGIDDYNDTHPEKCLDMFLNIMKNKGWFGKSRENERNCSDKTSLHDYEICWSLVSNNSKTSGRSSPTPSKRIKFEWKNLASKSPSL